MGAEQPPPASVAAAAAAAAAAATDDADVPDRERGLSPPPAEASDFCRGAEAVRASIAAAAEEALGALAAAPPAVGGESR